MGKAKRSLLPVFLFSLGFLMLPAWPVGEPYPVEISADRARSAGVLLGEGTPTGSGDVERFQAPPASENIALTVPKLGLENVPVPSGSSQALLDREGVLRMEESGLPWREGSNTFIAGHALGYPHTRVPRAFHELESLMPGDEILIESADNRRYTFRVYDRMTVEPDDTWVVDPVEGKTVVSLQTCVPIPTFEHRLIVLGELV